MYNYNNIKTEQELQSKVNEDVNIAYVHCFTESFGRVQMIRDEARRICKEKGWSITFPVPIGEDIIR